MRKTFSGKGPYFYFEQAENAMRAERINKMLDSGLRVFGDDGPDKPGNWHEIEEAIEPHSNGISVKTKSGTIVKIFAYDASEARQGEK
jgi:hypothetical protein